MESSHCLEFDIICEPLCDEFMPNVSQYFSQHFLVHETYGLALWITLSCFVNFLLLLWDPDHIKMFTLTWENWFVSSWREDSKRVLLDRQNILRTFFPRVVREGIISNITWIVLTQFSSYISWSWIFAVKAKNVCEKSGITMLVNTDIKYTSLQGNKPVYIIAI